MRILMLILVTLAIASCSADRGWRVSFGVSPVSQIDDKQQLTQSEETEREGHYARR